MVSTTQSTFRDKAIPVWQGMSPEFRLLRTAVHTLVIKITAELERNHLSKPELARISYGTSEKPLLHMFLMILSWTLLTCLVLNLYFG